MCNVNNWCFTINNYTEDDITLLDNIDCKYIIYGKEVGESGTPHLQGFVVFKINKRLSGCKKLHKTAHWEASKGTALQASEYCKKDGNFTERGDCPKSPAVIQAERWKRTRELAKEGRIDEIDDEHVVKYYRTLKMIERDNMSKPADLDHVCGLWYYGDSGSGKTTKARTEHPGAYLKSRDHWWDGYRNEEVVILDDFDKFHIKLGAFLKDWADKWSFKAETKGSYSWIRPRLFIITSQYHPNDIFQDSETRDAIRRRYTLLHFKRGQDPVYELEPVLIQLNENTIVTQTKQ